MTKKDYELIANEIRNRLNYDRIYCNAEFVLTQLSEDIADSLQQENPKFDRNRFLIACGLEQ